jgi:glutathione synthase/RimK-type ligase-like ATP-grasp enzyme
LLGWDIAPVESGAVVVEVNHLPDFRLHQIADRRGILDAALVEFLRDRDAHAVRWRRRR